jgi:hypothetical protein
LAPSRWLCRRDASEERRQASPLPSSVLQSLLWSPSYLHTCPLRQACNTSPYSAENYPEGFLSTTRISRAIFRMSLPNQSQTYRTTPLRGSPSVQIGTCYPTSPEDLLRARSCGTAVEGRSLACRGRALDPASFVIPPPCITPACVGFDLVSITLHVIKILSLLKIFRLNGSHDPSTFRLRKLFGFPLRIFYRRPRPCV